jgi:hypothetical protein
MAVSQNLKERFPYLIITNFIKDILVKEKIVKQKRTQFREYNSIFLPIISSFYLFLIHFSRLSFKISGLHFQLTKDVSVQRFLLSICIFILQNI